MKQIIPFKKELLFKTKVSEITSISLEHTLSLKKDDLISGEFRITGDYKMTEGSINREKFDFKLPFDIALDSRYDMSSIIIDIDNFYYEVINNESLQVNIDVYVEGEKQEEQEKLPPLIEESPKEEVQPETMELSTTGLESTPLPQNLIKEDQKFELEIPRTVQTEERTISNATTIPPTEEPRKIKEEGNKEEPKEVEIAKSLDSTIRKKEEFPDQEIQYQKPTSLTLEENPIIKNQNEFNIFENIDNSDTYVTYHVYIVKENDTIDSITKKYDVTKEDLSLYNNIEEMKPGTKLIIPN